MFGYVRVAKGELLVRHDELYSGIYCGLCKEMGRCTGQCSRLSLSYDMVFLYLIRSALLGKKPEIYAGRCLLHPLKVRPVARGDEILQYCARVSSLLCYGKVCDDIADEGGIKKLIKKLLLPFVKSMKKRANLSDLHEKIETNLRELSEIESRKSESVDESADCFGRLLGEIFRYGLDGDKAKIAYKIGFHTGRWIYTTDAADDISEDMKNGSYNPFLLLYGGEIDDDRKKIIEMTSVYDLKYAVDALDLCDIEGDCKKIAENILYLGMPRAMKKALWQAKEKKS